MATKRCDGVTVAVTTSRLDPGLTRQCEKCGKRFVVGPRVVNVSCASLSRRAARTGKAVR